MCMANSYVDILGDGSTTIFNIPFGFLDRAHIVVFVDGVGTSYSWVGDAAISITPAPAIDAVVRIKRQTPNTPVVDFRDGESLTESDLDAVNLQALYLTQESSDSLTDVLQTNNAGRFDAVNKRIENLADPVNQQDAVTKQWAETGMSSQLFQAENARNAAQAAQAASEAARDQSQAAQAASESARDQSQASQAAAATSEANAAASATAAATSASNAAGSASAAATSETNAAASEAAAAASENAAAASATAAATSESNAASSEAAAAGSASAASSSANLAQLWAEQADNTDVSGPGTRSAKHWAGVAQGAAVIPSGIIAMWSGLITNIPVGWLLCDGTNGTPDLRDRFIVGAGGAYAEGDTGGAASVALTEAQMPAHNHGFSGSTASGGAHNHAVNTALTAGTVRIIGSETNSFAGFQNTSWGVNWTSRTDTVRWEGAHAHSFSGTTDTKGSGQAHENRPPYFALAYIMKA